MQNTHRESATKVLVTGAGGPAAISLMKALRESNVQIHAADMDAHAAGLYLVPPSQRMRLPAGKSEDFVDTVLNECQTRGIHILVPTVDSELIPLAAERIRFEEHGIMILLAGDEQSLGHCLDKWDFAQRCQGLALLPKTALFDDYFDASQWQLPFILKPRSGSGSRGFRIIRSTDELDLIERNDQWIVQEYLPGEEYSVDVLLSSTGEALAAVPRKRLKVDSGVAVMSCTVKDQELISAATKVAEGLKLRFVINVQFRRAAEGNACLLEINPRIPGTMPLTVASGINMPRLAIEELQGISPKRSVGEFAEIAVVRFLEERFIRPQDVEHCNRAHVTP